MVILFFYPKNKLKKPKQQQTQKQNKHFGYDKLINEFFGVFFNIWNPCYVDWQLLNFLGHFHV